MKRYAQILSGLLIKITFLETLSGCAGPLSLKEEDLASLPDFSGHWEIDYSQSDSVQNQLSAAFRQVQRDFRLRQEAAEKGTPYQGLELGNIDDMLALAKIAELITDFQLLEVYQDSTTVRIKRGDSFSLICSLDPIGYVDSYLGREHCRWDGSQLHFLVHPSNQFSISHQFTLAPEGLRLAHKTLVSAPASRGEFAITRVFSRFDPSNRGYSCTETLSKGLVCTTETTKTSVQ